MITRNYVLIALVLGAIMILKKDSNTPRGIKNKNPLNIRENGINWQGKTGDDGDFVQFDNAQNGIRAAARILKTYRDKYGLTSVFDIVMRWAPPSENDTTSYIDDVAAKIGVGRNESLAISDYPALIEAMIKHENGIQPYDEATIQAGFEQGFLS